MKHTKQQELTYESIVTNNSMKGDLAEYYQ
jgi:hypothetical protein